MWSGGSGAKGHLAIFSSLHVAGALTPAWACSSHSTDALSIAEDLWAKQADQGQLLVVAEGLRLETKGSVFNANGGEGNGLGGWFSTDDALPQHYC